MDAFLWCSLCFLPGKAPRWRTRRGSWVCVHMPSVLYISHSHSHNMPCLGPGLRAMFTAKCFKRKRLFYDGNFISNTFYSNAINQCFSKRDLGSHKGSRNIFRGPWLFFLFTFIFIFLRNLFHWWKKQPNIIQMIISTIEFL